MKQIAFCLVGLLASLQSVRAEERVLKNELVIRSTADQAW